MIGKLLGRLKLSASSTSQASRWVSRGAIRLVETLIIYKLRDERKMFGHIGEIFS